MPIKTFLLVSLALPLSLTLVETRAAEDDARIDWLKKNAIVLRSIDPENEDFADLAPLRKIIGDARIVMLGEQTHGDGATFQAKCRLVKFLHQKMGFDVLAVESGLYDCRKAWALLREGKDPYDSVSSGVFGIWTRSEQFQPMIDYLGIKADSKRPLELCGFDCQLTAKASQENLVDDIKKIADKLPVKDLEARTLIEIVDAVTAMVKDDEEKPKEADLRKRHAALATFERVLLNAKPNDELSEKELAYWRQLAGSLVALAESKRVSAEGEKAAKKANSLRDEQMARNLIWLAREAYPKRKIIVWAASYHLMRNPASVRPSEKDRDLPADYYRDVTTMGDRIWKAFGSKSYTLGFIAADGKAGVPDGKPWKLAPIESGSLEALLVGAGHKNAIVNFRDLDKAGEWLKEKRLSRPLGHKDMTADWTDVFDGVVFTRTMTPSTLSKRAETEKPEKD
jgi:erythromycin esterase